MTVKCVSPVCDGLVSGKPEGEVLGPAVRIRGPGAVSKRILSHLTTPPVPHSIHVVANCHPELSTLTTPSAALGRGVHCSLLAFVWSWYCVRDNLK